MVGAEDPEQLFTRAAPERVDVVRGEPSGELDGALDLREVALTAVTRRKVRFEARAFPAGIAPSR